MPIRTVPAPVARVSSTPLIIAGQPILPGETHSIELPIALLHTQTPISMPIQVIRGKRDGPRLFICAAIHGDELNGVEIIRRLHQEKVLSRLSGTLITVPIVNIYGVIHHSRYLPDRRDLNRSFPGAERGSLAGRLAHLFMDEIVANATHGIDLHTGALHRSNLPQIRANLDDPETAAMAEVFEVPVIINADLRDGSLRAAAGERGVPVLLYEAGEALRLDELSIRAGVQGIKNVMRLLGMIPKVKVSAKPRIEAVMARSSSWIRAPESGIFRAFASLGGRVKRGDQLGMIASPFGTNETEVTATSSGIIIGRTSLPLISEGDALFHIARFEAVAAAEETVTVFTDSLTDNEQDEVSDEPPII